MPRFSRAGAQVAHGIFSLNRSCAPFASQPFRGCALCFVVQSLGPTISYSFRTTSANAGNMRRNPNPSPIIIADKLYSRIRYPIPKTVPDMKIRCNMDSIDRNVARVRGWLSCWIQNSQCWAHVAGNKLGDDWKQRPGT